MDYDGLLELAKKRRSMRRFKPDPMPDGYVEKILEVAKWAMSGANGQPWEFVVVKDAETRNKITDIVTDQTKRVRTWELTRVEDIRQPQMQHPTRTQVGIKDAPVIILVCGDPRVYQATVQGHFVFSAEYDNFHMSLANATMLIHLAAVSLGLSSRWVTILPNWEGQVKDLLKIPGEFRLYAIVPVGYAAYAPPPTYRRELDEMVHYEKYDQSKYRTDEEVIKFLIELRNKTRPAYTVEKSSWR
jgi:nitroreductase